MSCSLARVVGTKNRRFATPPGGSDETPRLPDPALRFLGPALLILGPAACLRLPHPRQPPLRSMSRANASLSASSSPIVAAVRRRHRYSPPRPARQPATSNRTAAMGHPPHRSGATTAQPTPEDQLGCRQKVRANPAGRGEATGLMPQSPTRVADAMTGDRLRRPAPTPAQLHVEVTARHGPPVSTTSVSACSMPTRVPFAQMAVQCSHRSLP